VAQSKEAKAKYMRDSRAANPEKHRAASKAFNERHADRLKAERNARYAANKPAIRAARHGTTLEALVALWAKQSGKCGVCEKPLAFWPNPATHIDHDHNTGRVRGFLCRSCNLKEGWVRRYGAKLAAYLGGAK
jgi:hypothetical protein